MITLNTLEQEGSSTEMVFRASIAANQLMFQIKKEALRQFQNQLITLRKQKKPNTNCYAIKVLLSACRSERSWIDLALSQIEDDEKFIEEINRIRAIEPFDPFSMQEEIVQ
jgi:hypothetical protein